MEPELTARATQRATTEDIAALRAAVSAMEKSKNTKERLTADMAFHDAVFRASGSVSANSYSSRFTGRC